MHGEGEFIYKNRVTDNGKIGKKRDTGHTLLNMGYITDNGRTIK